ncbi:MULTISPECIES: sensor histidine kinase [unclassified Acinetobacter]|uniref:sensor histidine kinase n=1 Tax=unclassified Acinetobacter TaxID=196816 RepID=UPI0019095EF2|nr:MULTISPECIES: sensor histidine kinase KdpD [unclassified Acinetobacter]MBK0063404.1 sensor histidine kinase KdpD [Acinetobacter sp. S55]MBK0066684.1 sensor histidine kinase KdpD [Acinetobacter sp. S54]
MTTAREDQASALLNHVNRYQAGRLTVFLGAAPGVGKTYAMLSRAQELIRQGIDIKVGIVETHGRAETLALTEGLNILPRKHILYKEQYFDEMDLDAILTLRPAIILVDELAHRNIPNSRHERRWQDVNEILDAGIDVFTTMNIQHLESLNDVVYQLTGIRVSETVPDRVFDRIRDIRLIDLPVNELIERLQQGKVYLPDQAQSALQRFFSVQNLTALRELAMQFVAEHVDLDLRETYLAQGTRSIPLKNEMMVAIDGRGQSEYLVRAASRFAEKKAISWTVVHVAQKHFYLEQGNSSIVQKEVEQAFQLARQLGARTEILYGIKVAQTLNDAIQEKAISSIMLGYTLSTRLTHIFKKAIHAILLEKNQRLELILLPLNNASQNKPSLHELNHSLLSLKETFLILAVTVISIILARIAEVYIGVDDLSIIFIVAVLLVATKTRMLAAVITALLFFFAYNFFFIEPRFTFQISAHQGVVTVIAFLAAALISSRLASRLRQQVLSLRAANAYSSRMQDVTARLSSAMHLEDVIQIAQKAFQQQFNFPVWIMIAQDMSTHSNQQLTEKEKIAADWSLKHQQACGKYTDTLSQIDWWFIPLLAQKQNLGVVGLNLSHQLSNLNVEQKRLIESMVEQIAQSILRTQLANELEQAKISSETERLRSALLSSVSHDLRSPLASMMGSADTLKNYHQALSQEDQDTLLETIRMEGERLDRYIQNLLDMTRLGHDGLKLNRDWIGVDELIGSATQRLKRYMPEIKIDLQQPAQSVNLYVHPALIEQAIFNVLENAAKFSPKDQAIQIRTKKWDEHTVQIEIEDQGAGIPEDERNRIFDMFYTMERGDRGRFGTGLGLTIVKAIIGAHMGTIDATTGSHHQGTLIRMRLPIHPEQV